MLISIEEFEVMAGEIADEIPEIYYEGLNGGIILKEEVRLHEISRENAPIYVMGLYVKDIMGCRIELYYGSFCKVGEYFSPERWRMQIKSTLLHEFRHHVETMCGNVDLILEDEKEIEEIKRGRGWS